MSKEEKKEKKDDHESGWCDMTAKQFVTILHAVYPSLYGEFVDEGWVRDITADLTKVKYEDYYHMLSPKFNLGSEYDYDGLDVYVRKNGEILLVLAKQGSRLKYFLIYAEIAHKIKEGTENPAVLCEYVTALLPKESLGDWRISRFLGGGANGTVLRMRHKDDAKDVRVVKIQRFDVDQTVNFNNEVMIHRKLFKHGLAPKVYSFSSVPGMLGQDVGEKPGMIGFVFMDEIDGILEDWMFEAENIDFALKWITSTLDKLSELKITHGDLHWKNIGYKLTGKSASGGKGKGKGKGHVPQMQLYLLDFGWAIDCEALTILDVGQLIRTSDPAYWELDLVDANEGMRTELQQVNDKLASVQRKTTIASGGKVGRGGRLTTSPKAGGKEEKELKLESERARLEQKIKDKDQEIQLKLKRGKANFDYAQRVFINIFQKRFLDAIYVAQDLNARMAHNGFNYYRGKIPDMVKTYNDIRIIYAIINTYYVQIRYPNCIVKL